MANTPVVADDASALLRIYVNDHRAGAVAGLRLARRCARRNADTPFAPVLDAIVRDIAVDARMLETVADRLDVPPNRAKALFAAVAELVGRLKLNGRLRRYSPLSRLLEIEALLAGIDAKRSLWRALQPIDLPATSDVDFEALEARATDQRRRLLPLHQEAARVLARADDLERAGWWWG